MLSLNEIKFPVHWNLKPNPTSYVDHVYQEGLEFGVWRPDNKRDIVAHNNVVSLSKFFWPTVDFERLVMGGELMLWFFTFDDALDSGIYDDTKSLEIVRRMSAVFMEGTLCDDASGPEKVGYRLRQKCLEMCGKRRRDTFNRFITSCVQWIDSIIPFNKVKDGGSPHIELYSFLRKINIGAYPCVTLSEVFIDHYLDHSIWSSPRWVKMNENIAIVVTLINDLVSYEKEVNDNAGALNPLYFFQQQRKFNLPDSYNHMVNLIHFFVQDYLANEESFLKSLEPFENEKQQQDIYFMLDHLHFLISGSRMWSMQTPRYCSPTSPFIEMRPSFNQGNLMSKL
ncbi:hypothetical protein DFA_09346 [Cavenderia fasciculata]|uniref:Terpene synthase 1 n=1 Tax=Cavenderia fasciculata TaxID=261658 RepID=TPS1_CACFS|nr:uncharacterized protein DFA_09346 [Cavenderia fasciculata]F4Q7D4.1 RecName: Full=Terpene synthase 1 [Cavenderia fasciculata]AXN72968.1 terpene synthase [Cavenderia fasciculata]EGG16316.1 hypothetical protein DFA_09346 [Cavenderia fasciculata]|eukprot:XP_004354700.1 hypothetical protein DFA_09346 [Cavenderia fasciculata]